MTDWVIWITGAITGSLRILICLFLICRLLSSQKPDKRCVLCGVAGVLTITAVLFAFPLSDFFRIGLESVWIAGCACRFQKADVRMSLFVSILYEIAVTFWQFLLASGMGIALQSDVYLKSETLQGQTAVWLTHFLLAGAAVYFLKRPEMNAKAGFRLAVTVILAGFIAVVTLSEQTVLSIPDDMLTMWTILSVVLMMSVLVFNMNRQYEVEKEVAHLRSEQAELLERDYTALNRAYAVNAKLFHDFHNHIGVLRQMLIHQNYESAVQYLDELQEPLQEMTDTIWTGDETVDYLINSKTAKAASRQIQMKVQVEFPRRTNIRSADLCAIIGNLLDNALEGADKVPDPSKRFVSLSVRRINQMLIIKAENSFFDAPQEENGQLKTTKKEQGLHGWGLKSAQTAAEKYDGLVQTTYKENRFRAVATLSYHAAPAK